MKPRQNDVFDNLTTLNKIVGTLNRFVDVQGILDTALSDLVNLMGLETGWIFLKDSIAQEPMWGKGYILGAYHNLPPALDTDVTEVWNKGCDCQGLCNKGLLTQAYNEVRCTRLASSKGDRRGLNVHASTPLLSGSATVGILNVAGRDWESFQPQALALLGNVGSHMGIAIERARLFDQLQEKRVHEQAALLEMSNQLLSKLHMDDLLDYIVVEASRLLKAEACAILLPKADSEYLYFQAASGWLHDPVREGRIVPADETSGPGLVMQTQTPMFVEDIRDHDPVPWLPDWIQVEGFRGHAVVPLIVEGRSTGVMVLNTRKVRPLDEEEIRFLRLMVNQAAIAIEKARLHQEEIERYRLERELAVGRQIQLSLLPKSVPEIDGWEFAATNQSARQVSGDFFDFFELPGETGRIGIVIADVMDKGVPAALFMALSRTVIRTTALSGRSPAQALERANELILKDSRASLFLSAVFVELDTQSGRITYTNAGHTRPKLFRSASGDWRELKSDGVLLAVFDEIDLEEREIEMHCGDLLILYTDGLSESINAEGQSFGNERIMEVVSGKQDAHASEVLESVLESARQFSGETPQSDDLTLIVIRKSGP